jgi:2-polyprenyl-6-methoxyphenol hydroxylase-like FAD-dependent oxidoreductase
MKHLLDFGLMDAIKELNMGISAEAARVFFNEKQLAVLKGMRKGANFGIIQHQEKFLLYLHRELCKSPLYIPYLGHTAIDFDQDHNIVTNLSTTDKDKKNHKISGDYFFITTGRGTHLRKKMGLEAKKIDTHWNILWMLLPKPNDPHLLPNGFRAYLNGASLFILYTNSEGMIQMAWSNKDENILKEKDFKIRKSNLLESIPKAYKELIETGYLETNKSQFLKVECDRLNQWHSKNVMFLGDAAHTMSPVAGQGINLAMRDSIVTANHIIQALQNNENDIENTFIAIQQERTKEVKLMQTFQQKLGYFMLGAPSWQSKIFFFFILRVFTIIGLKQRMLKMVQGGVSKVDFEHKITAN